MEAHDTGLAGCREDERKSPQENIFRCSEGISTSGAKGIHCKVSDNLDANKKLASWTGVGD